MIRFSKYVFAILLLLPPLAFAAPVINSASGTFVDGGTYVISGSGFEAKTQAAPALWDTFESGTSGVAITGGTPTTGVSNWEDWPHDPGDSGMYYGSYTRTGSNLSCREYGKEAYGGGSGNQYDLDLEDTDFSSKMFVSWWQRIDDESDCQQVKRFLMQHYKVGWDTYLMDHWIVNKDEFLQRTGGVDLFEPDYSPDLVADAWHHYELEVQISSALNTADGFVRLYISDAEQNAPYNTQAESGALDMIDVAGEFYNQFIMRHWEQRCDSGVSRNVFYDDVYIDYTWQRVEIGDSATYANCTHREIQQPTAWTDGEITVTINQGSFADCSNVYLFVVDTSGLSNFATGYGPYKIGTSCGSTQGGGTGTINTGGTGTIGF